MTAATADAWAGVAIVEDVEEIAAGIRTRSWVATSLGAAGGALDGLAVMSDPVGALLQYGIAWLIEHVKPLSEPLDWLAGKPDVIVAHAATWRTVAGDLTGQADDLVHAVRDDVVAWSGAAATAYRVRVARHESALRTLSRAAETMALMTEGAGVVVGGVRQLIRDAVATVVSRLVTYAGELVLTAGAATPWVIEQVSTLCAAWAAKIERWVCDLLESLRRLRKAAQDLGELIRRLAGAGGRTGAAPVPPGSPMLSAAGVPPTSGVPPPVGAAADPRPPHDPFSGPRGHPPDPSAPGAGDPHGADTPEHLRDLGTDPAVGKYRADEAETARRVERRLGIRLRRCANGKVDWIGPGGETYDAVGNFDAGHFDQQWPNLKTRIVDHAAKADRVPVDVSRFTPEQRRRVQDFIRAGGFGDRVFTVGD